MTNRYREGEARNQLVLFPTSMEDMIGEENPVRVIDAFIDELDFKELGFKNAESKKTGNKGYNPKDMMKLYIYGYCNRIRSSRRLMAETYKNIEVMWLIRGLHPDFRCIADFRKDNKKSMKEVYKKFLLVCKEMGAIGEISSQDGEKIKAVNSKDKNYTLNKLDDKQRRIMEKIEKHLKEMDELDEKEKEEKLIKVEELKERMETYKRYEKEIEETGEKQISLTDPESRLMKNNGKFEVCYNNQVVVNEKNKIVTNFEVSNEPADTGKITSATVGMKENLEIKDEIVINITDKGYIERKDMMRSLEEGIIPVVTLQEGKTEIELETEYEEAEITEEIKGSKDKNNIKKSLRAGVIPTEYKNYIREIKVVEKKIKTEIEEETEEKSDDELREEAMERKVYIRNKEKNKVYCLEGEILREKSRSKEGIKYCNKLGCKRCKNPCTKSEYKEVVFKGNNREVIPKGSKEKVSRKRGSKKKTIKVVKMIFVTSKELTKKRMGISEQPHARQKWWDEMDHFLLKGKEKVEAELAIYYTGYNIRRMIKEYGVKEILWKIKGMKKELQDNCAQKREKTAKREIKKEEKSSKGSLNEKEIEEKRINMELIFYFA